MDKLTKGLLHNRYIVVFFLAIIVLLGGISYYLVPKQEKSGHVHSGCARDDYLSGSLTGRGRGIRDR